MVKLISHPQIPAGFTVLVVVDGPDIDGPERVVAAESRAERVQERTGDDLTLGAHGGSHPAVTARGVRYGWAGCRTSTSGASSSANQR